MLLGPVLGTCSFWAQLSYNLGSNHDVSSLEHMGHIGLGKLICDECVYPNQEVFLPLSRAEMKERGWEEGGGERMMMVDENMRWKNKTDKNNVSRDG